MKLISEKIKLGIVKDNGVLGAYQDYMKGTIDHILQAQLDDCHRQVEGLREKIAIKLVEYEFMVKPETAEDEWYNHATPTEKRNMLLQADQIISLIKGE